MHDKKFLLTILEQPATYEQAPRLRGNPSSHICHISSPKLHQQLSEVFRVIMIHFRSKTKPQGGFVEAMGIVPLLTV